MVILRKNWPIVIPPYKPHLEFLGSLPFVVYDAFNWTSQPLTSAFTRGLAQQDDKAFPIRGLLAKLQASATFNFPTTTRWPVLYPRMIDANLQVPAALHTLCEANGIMIGSPGYASNLSTVTFSGWLNRFEANGYTDVASARIFGGNVPAKTCRSDRWQAGDVLSLIKIQPTVDADQDRSYAKSSGFDYVAWPPMIAHDQAQVAIAAAACNRVKLCYWFNDLGTSSTAFDELDAIYASAVAGLSVDHAYARVSSDAAITAGWLAIAQDFFGI